VHACARAHGSSPRFVFVFLLLLPLGRQFFFFVSLVDTSFTDALSFPTGVVGDTGSHRLTCNDDGSASYQHFTDLECKSGAGPEHVAPGEGECAVAQGVSYCLYCAATFPAPADRAGTTLYSDAACTARMVGPRYGELLAGDCGANEGRQYYCSADGKQLNRIDFAGTTCEPDTWISVAKWDAGASTCVPVAKRDGEGDTVVYRKITCPSVVATPSPMAFPLDTSEPFTLRNARSATDCTVGCEPFLAERLGQCSLTYAGSSAFSRARVCSADGPRFTHALDRMLARAPDRTCTSADGQAGRDEKERKWGENKKNSKNRKKKNNSHFVFLSVVSFHFFFL
jgi:hypothetical protein